MGSTLKAVIESLATAHKKNLKSRIDIELSNGNVLERLSIKETHGQKFKKVVATKMAYVYSSSLILTGKQKIDSAVTDFSKMAVNFAYNSDVKCGDPMALKIFSPNTNPTAKSYIDGKFWAQGLISTYDWKHVGSGIWIYYDKNYQRFVNSEKTTTLTFEIADDSQPPVSQSVATVRLEPCH